MVADVLALADAAGTARFHLVGHDWGGAVAWAVAALAPDRVRTLTSVSTPHPRALARAVLTSGQALRSWYMGAFQLPLLPEWILLAAVVRCCGVPWKAAASGPIEPRSTSASSASRAR